MSHGSSGECREGSAEWRRSLKIGGDPDSEVVAVWMVSLVLESCALRFETFPGWSHSERGEVSLTDPVGQNLQVPVVARCCRGYPQLFTADSSDNNPHDSV